RSSSVMRIEYRSVPVITPTSSGRSFLVQGPGRGSLGYRTSLIGVDGFPQCKSCTRARAPHSSVALSSLLIERCMANATDAHDCKDFLSTVVAVDLAATRSVRVGPGLVLHYDPRVAPLWPRGKHCAL